MGSSARFFQRTANSKNLNWWAPWMGARLTEKVRSTENTENTENTEENNLIPYFSLPSVSSVFSVDTSITFHGCGGQSVGYRLRMTSQAAMDYYENRGMAKRSGVTIRGNCCDTRNKLQIETILWMLVSMISPPASVSRIVLSAPPPDLPVAMATPVGPPATTSCEPRQARKGAAAAVDSGAGVRPAGGATPTRLGSAA